MRRGDIVIIELPAADGREQMGVRPALIVHCDATLSQVPVVLVVPLTSQMNALRFPHTISVQPSIMNGLTAHSVLLIFQLRAVDSRRIRGTAGRLEPEVLDQVNAELHAVLGLA